MIWLMMVGMASVASALGMGTFSNSSCLLISVLDFVVHPGFLD